MKYHTFRIDRDYSSIYNYLKEHKFSENYIKNLRKTWGNFVVNGVITNIRQPLHIGDSLQINSSPNNKTEIKSCILPLDIVYEDEYYLLINKPSGLSCMPNRSHYSQNLAGAVSHYMKDKDDNFVVRILNRLDKDTAGIIIIAKDSISQKEIKNIDKTYYAICEGKIDSPICINNPIKTITNNGVNERKRVVSNDGQEATTFVTPIKYNNTLSLISLKLIHGRTHQIRLHLSSINHPLVGDELYGKRNDTIKHTALICKQISFYHPYFNTTLSFEVDFPKDFIALMGEIKGK